jgi:hypothetical protein
VVRTTRLEVIDRNGRVRVVIGTLANDDYDEDDDTIGVSIRDARGRERLVLTTDDKTCAASVTGSGNNVAGIDADGRGSVSVYVAAPDGTVVQSWAQPHHHRPPSTSVPRTS